MTKNKYFSFTIILLITFAAPAIGSYSTSTFKDVLIVSKGLSTTRRIAIASKGTPIANKTICIPAIEAEGIPGAPIEATIAIKNTVMIIIVDNSTP